MVYLGLKNKKKLSNDEKVNNSRSENNLKKLTNSTLYESILACRTFLQALLLTNSTHPTL